MVVCCSPIASRSADCVLGVARFISSARTIWDIIGPDRNSNSPFCWLYIDAPVTSLGSRSGVNWTLRNWHPVVTAMDLASIVLPTPGTSSTSTCPRLIRDIVANRTVSCLPTMTLPMLMMIRSASSVCLEWILEVSAISVAVAAVVN